jgi:hypothetical protein
MIKDPKLGLTTVSILVGFTVLTMTMTTTGLGSQISAQNQNVDSANVTRPDANALYSLTAEEKTYPVGFNIQGGNLDSMTVDGDQAILLVIVTASMNGGELMIELPRDLIDSKTPSDTDKPFLVYEDDSDNAMSFVESNTTEKVRTLVITYNGEDDTIQIQGTEVFSEPAGLTNY